MVGYDTGSTPPSVGTLNTIANGNSNNVFNGGANALTLAQLHTSVFEAICSAAESTRTESLNIQRWIRKEIQNQAVWHSVSRYVDRFATLPRWMPCYNEYEESGFKKVPSIYDETC